MKYNEGWEATARSSVLSGPSVFVIFTMVLQGLDSETLGVSVPSKPRAGQVETNTKNATLVGICKKLSVLGGLTNLSCDSLRM